MKKLLIVVLAVVLVFAFTTTAFATYVDYATWSSSVCKYGFYTSDCVEKASSQRWSYVNVGLYGLSFASAPAHNYLLFQPRSNGVYVGAQNYILSLSDPNYTETGSNIYSAYDAYDDIYLRITNPNPGNNMVSSGFWEGFVK